MTTVDTHRNVNCPSLAELADLSKTGDPVIGEHVGGCRRCRALLRLLDEREPSAVPELTPRELPQAHLPHRQAPAAPTFGEVCIANGDVADGTLLVCVVLDWREETPQTLEVAPVSTEIHAASEWDLLLQPDEGALGYEAIAEVWNHGTILTEQITERLGPLVADGEHRLDAMYEALLNQEAPPVELPRGVPVISDDDPRAIFQEEEAERVRPFWQPAARLYAEKLQQVATVGVLIRAWLDEAGYDEADYAKELGWLAKDVVLVASDRFEPQWFSGDRLAEAFARTDVQRDDLEQALWNTVRPEHFAFAGPVMEQRAAFRRTAGRRGRERKAEMRSRAAAEAPPSAEEQERRRTQYITDVLDALEEKRSH